nr:DUF551 domain-containing protein [Klebsiella pneumoniae]
MTSKLTSEILDDETLAELIAFRRSRVEYCQKEGLPYQKALHDSMMLALEELQERRKVERDTEPYGFTDGDRRGMIYKPEHSDRLSEPVPVYRHAQPAPVVPDGYVMVPKEMTDEIGEAISMRARCCGGIALDIYDAMLATAPQSPGSEPATAPGKWIPVSERMPEAGGDMIVFTDGIVMSGVSYTKKKGFYIQALEYDDDEPVDSVTHWMPLPAAPQEVKGE